MPKNQIAPFATGDGANTLSTAAYLAAGFLAQGFQPGVASSAAINTALRQVSTVAAALGQFTADNQPADVLDDGVPANFESKFTAALKGAFASSSVHFGIATGTGDAMVVSAIPPMMPTTSGGYQAGTFLVLKTPATANTSTAPTVNSNAIGNIAITKAGGAPLSSGDDPPSSWIILFFDGIGCFRLGPVPSDASIAAPNGGLAKSSNAFLLAFLNLVADNRASPAANDVLAMERAADGATVAVTAQALATYIASLFQQNNTFARITSANQVGLSLAQTGDFIIPRGVTTTVPLSNVTVPPAFGSVSNGVLTVAQSGFYLIVFAGAMFLLSSNSHTGDFAQFTFSLKAPNAGGPLSQAVPIGPSGGQPSANFVTSTLVALHAGDQVSLTALGNNFFNDAGVVGVSGYTNMTVALLNSLS